MFNDTRASKSLREILTQYCEPTEELVEDFVNAAKLINVKKGQPIVRQGEMCTDFVLNRNGLFRVSHVCGNVEDTLLFGTSGDV